MHRVVVVGAGFAGLSAARTLIGEQVEVTIVDQRNFHTFQPLLYEVATAGDGLAGLELTRRLRPDVVLCDIGLPGGLDGYAVARDLRADPTFADLRLIALTGYGQAEDQRRAREAGFDLHLTKPVDPTKLLYILGSGG